MRIVEKPIENICAGDIVEGLIDGYILVSEVTEYENEISWFGFDIITGGPGKINGYRGNTIRDVLKISESDISSRLMN